MHESYGILNIFVGIHLSSISVIVVKAASQRALAARGVAAPVVPKEVEVRGLHQPWNCWHFCSSSYPSLKLTVRP